MTCCKRCGHTLTTRNRDPFGHRLCIACVDFLLSIERDAHIESALTDSDSRTESE